VAGAFGAGWCGVDWAGGEDVSAAAAEAGAAQRAERDEFAQVGEGGGAPKVGEVADFAKRDALVLSEVGEDGGEVGRLFA
jgi:hypothetical protein